MSRRAAALVLVVAVLAAGCVAGDGTSATTATPDNGTAVIVREVVDGDTVEVRYPDGRTDTVRLLGVDTPEVHAENDPGEFEGVPDTAAGERCLLAAGRNASAYVERRVLGERAWILTDERADRRDRYGRLLAYVLHGGANLNYRLVAAGHARVFDAPFSRAERFYAAESRARERGRGLWRCRSPA